MALKISDKDRAQLEHGNYANHQVMAQLDRWERDEEADIEVTSIFVWNDAWNDAVDVEYIDVSMDRMICFLRFRVDGFDQ